MRKKGILITGASGEIGDSLIRGLIEQNGVSIVTLDLKPLPFEAQGQIAHVQGDIMDFALLSRLMDEYEIETIFHLAAILSTRAEYFPEMAHRINVEGTLGLLKLAAEHSERRGEPVKFLFPSSIAAYGMPNLDVKSQHPRVREDEWNNPITMYGCNKLYCEMLGVYYSQHLRQLADDRPVMLDFRGLRFPGLLSAFTIPTGGTSDYGSMMLHAAAKGTPFACYVREDSSIAFMAMPDAVKALLDLARVPSNRLTRRIYNVTSFSLSAEGFQQKVLQYYPDAQITFEPNPKRQRIIDSWPIGMDDDHARRDWDWSPEFDLDGFFEDYLVPNIQKYYASV